MKRRSCSAVPSLSQAYFAAENISNLKMDRKRSGFQKRTNPNANCGSKSIDGLKSSKTELSQDDVSGECFTLNRADSINVENKSKTCFVQQRSLSTGSDFGYTVSTPQLQEILPVLDTVKRKDSSVQKTELTAREQLHNSSLPCSRLSNEYSRSIIEDSFPEENQFSIETLKSDESREIGCSSKNEGNSQSNSSKQNQMRFSKLLLKTPALNESYAKTTFDMREQHEGNSMTKQESLELSENNSEIKTNGNPLQGENQSILMM